MVPRPGVGGGTPNTRASHVRQASLTPSPGHLASSSLWGQAHLQREQVRATWKKEVCFTSCLFMTPMCYGSDGKKSTFNAGGPGSVPGLGRLP